MSRPDIHCALHKCAMWQNKPSFSLWKRLLHIVKYLSQTPHLGLIFVRPHKPFSPDQPILEALCDASFATEPASRSRLGWFFFVGGGLVSWDTKVISRVVTSSTEAECHALVQCGKENVFQREFLSELGFWKNLGPTLVFQDNTSAISLTNGTKCHKRSKHFGIEFEAFKQYIELGEMRVEHRSTNTLAADMLTKNLSSEKFCAFRDEVMGGKELQQHFN